jgi:WD40 repeat protein
MKLHLSYLTVVLGVILNTVLLSAQAPELILPIGHSDRVCDASYSPDGKMIATASNDRTVKIWNAENGRLLLTISGFTDFTQISRITFNPDGKSIMTLSQDGSIRIWDLKNGKNIHTFNDSNQRITDAKYSPDGNYLFLIPQSYQKDTMIHMWDEKKGRLLNIHQEKAAAINFVVFSPDSKYFLLSSGESSFQMLASASGDLIRNYDNDVSGAVFSPDGKKILTYSKRESNVWNAETGNLIATINTNPVSTPCFSADGKKILAAAHMEVHDGQWKNISTNSFEVEYVSGIIAGLYDATSGILIRPFIDPALNYNVESYLAENIYKILFSPDGKNIVTISMQNGNDSATCRVYNVDKGNLLFTKKIPYTNYTGISYSADSKRIFIITRSSSSLYEAGTGRLLHPYDAPKFRVSVNSEERVFIPVAGFSPNGKNIFAVHPDKNSVKIWNSQNGEMRFNLTGHSTPVSEAVFSADRKNVMAKSYNNVFNAKIWDLLTGKIVMNAEGPEWGSVEYFDEGQKIHTSLKSASGKTILKTWNTLNSQLLDTIELESDSIARYIFSPDNKTILVIDSCYNAKILNAKTGKELQRLDGPVANAEFSSDSKLMATTSWFDLVKIWDVETGKLIHSIRNTEIIGNIDTFELDIQGIDSVERIIVTSNMPYNSLSERAKMIVHNPEKKVQFSIDGKTLIYPGNFNIGLWDIQKGSLIKSFNGERASLSPDGSRILTFDYDDANNMIPKIRDMASGNLLFSLEADRLYNCIARFSPDGKNIITIKRDSVKIWNAKNGKLKSAIYFKGDFFDIDWKSERLIIHENSELVFYNIFSGKELYSFIAIDSTDYLVMTGDKYYMCSKNASNKLSWRVGNKLYSFEQFDLQYNRPDIVLERLGNPDTALIKIYRKAYEKRLRKSGFNEKMFTTEWHTPEMKILNADSLGNLVDQSILQLKVCGTDSRYKLNRLNIWINDVPLYGINGMSLHGEKTDSISRTISIPLSSGNNKIQVSCVNEKGVESFKESVELVYEPKEIIKPDLYIIALGASEYQDERWDLTYASKDANDLARLFENQKVNYKNIRVFRFLNKQVDLDSIRKIKPQLLKTHVDDLVIVFYAGHGLLDENLDYYLGSYKINFNNPVEKGMKYEDLGLLLDSIPARKKIMLIDACHSGEIDKEEELLVSDTKKATENVVFRSGGVQGFKVKSNLSYKNSFELMNELFADLRKGTGAIVISSAGSGEFAYEGEQWKNGVFTFAMIEGLRDLKAGSKGNKEISISELKNYVTKRVQQLTHGKQNPTSRSENLEFDFRIW